MCLPFALRVDTQPDSTYGCHLHPDLDILLLFHSLRAADLLGFISTTEVGFVNAQRRQRGTVNLDNVRTYTGGYLSVSYTRESVLLLRISRYIFVTAATVNEH